MTDKYQRGWVSLSISVRPDVLERFKDLAHRDRIKQNVLIEEMIADREAVPEEFKPRER